MSNQVFMRVLCVLLVVWSVSAYQVTYPDGNQGWNTTGPNYLKWDRVDTDPLNFTAVLTNVDTTNEEVLVSSVDGTLGSVLCPAPSGGWTTGSNFRVNLAQDPSHLDSLLAQSSEFNITAVSSNQSTTSVMPTSTSSASTTVSLSSSDTSTTPTGTSDAPRGANIRAGLLTAIGALTALFVTFF